MRLVSKTMIGRGLFVLTMLSSCVLSLPLTTGQLENEDVKVMKCIVEALADVLSRPRPSPVSQECVVTLKTDNRLVSILRHHNFLKELQEIAVQGHHEKAQLQRDAGMPDPTKLTPQTASDVADRSMVEALGGPGERSILSQKRWTGNGDGAEEKDESLGDEVSQEATDIAEEVKRENDKKPRSHIFESGYESSEGRAEKSEEDEEENEKKRGMSKENSEENMTKDNKDAGSGEKSDAPRNKSKKKFEEEDEEEIDKKSALFSHKQQEKPEEQEEEEDEETKRGSKESLKRRAKKGKAFPLKRKGVEKEAQKPNSREEVSHHSKEVSEEDEEMKTKDVQKSPEEKELLTIARRRPEERRGLEEEGSASRRSEEPEIESLAAIESELENVAQRLHDLRQG